MVAIDYDCVESSDLKGAVAGLTAFFLKYAVHVKAGLITPEDACPILVVTPTDESTIQDIGRVIKRAERTCEYKIRQGDQSAGYTEYLLSAFRAVDEQSDIPRGMALPASPILGELAERLNKFDTLEVA